MIFGRLKNWSALRSNPKKIYASRRKVGRMTNSGADSNWTIMLKAITPWRWFWLGWLLGGFIAPTTMVFVSVAVHSHQAGYLYAALPICSIPPFLAINVLMMFPRLREQIDPKPRRNSN